MFAYDSESNDPPAPIAYIKIRNVGANKSVTDVLMLVDTGADVTLVPRIILPALGLQQESLRPAGYNLADSMVQRHLRLSPRWN